MDNKQIPIKKETTNDRRPEPSFDLEQEKERARSRDEAFDTTDDGEELSFDLPRD